MSAFFSTFDWQHASLLGGAILGGVLVGVGILKESEKWSVAAMLVLIGVIIEPIFTIGLFLYDESISREQQSTIAALEFRLAPRGIKPDQRARMVAELSRSEFSGVKAGACTPSRGAVLPDIAPLATEINSILADAGWKALDWSGDCQAGYGILIRGSGAPSCRAPIEALDKAIPSELGPHIDFRSDLPSSPCPGIVMLIGVPPAT